MNIHEYQAKALLKSFGVSVSDGVPIMQAEEAEAAAKSLPGPVWVVKSQIHAGGRGKGRFKELGADAAGGVRVVKSVEDVVKNASEMLGNTLVTKQTGPAGKQVNRLYIEDGAGIDARALPVHSGGSYGRTRLPLSCSTEGGMDIEAVAEETPRRSSLLPFDPIAGYQPMQMSPIACATG